MMRALFAAIGGLRNHITYMDVVANNIANVNTAGFKPSRVTFKDMLSQTTVGASSPTANLGGTNPVQVGLGMTLAGIDVFHVQGALQSTGKLTDFAIQGNGFFVLNDGNRSVYTRDGAFDVSVSGELTNPTNGYRVMGWNATNTGVIDTNTPLVPLRIPFGQSTAAQETTAATLVGNLDAQAADGTTVTLAIDVHDSLGDPHPVQLTFTKDYATAVGNWTVAATSTDPAVSGAPTITSPVHFDPGGVMDTPAAGLLTLTVALDGTVTNATTPIGGGTTIDMTGVTQFAGDANLSLTFNNGFSAGALISFSLGPSGDITGIFSNGTNRTIAQMALAEFTNPAGLMRIGANNFSESNNSGTAIIGPPSTGGRGTVGSGMLEGSATDLAREFTNVVIAQRGFQASSRIISTADEMLQDLVNLNR